MGKRAEADGWQEVGGPNRSEDAGEPHGTGTRSSKGGPCWYEPCEGNMKEAETSKSMSTGLMRVMERARKNPKGKMRSLAHHIDIEALKRSFHRIREGAAVGVDGVTKRAYGENLEENLADLHSRLKGMKYRHQPIRRSHLPKGGGKTRPIGISTTEDKVVQGALSELLGVIYEQEFLDCSHGFRPGRSAHDALKALNKSIRYGEANWIQKTDVVAFFDSMDRPMLRGMLEERIGDKSLMRLIGKCIHVGVVDGAELQTPEDGTAQGSILSPLLGNIYLHHVIDKWYENEVKPRMRGRSCLVRYADDLVFGFEVEEDAKRVKKVLEKRLGRFVLSLAPDKTELLDFRRPSRVHQGGKGPNVFDFLGFTHYWRRGRKGGGSGRQGHNPAGESPVVSVARNGHVAISQFTVGNPVSIARCKRPGCPEGKELQRWAQSGGLASMGA